MERMLEYLHGLQARRDLRPDLVFFTGDAAYGSVAGDGGRIAEQFDQFGLFLEALLKVFDPPLAKEQLFLVPGNHDVDRNRIYEETYHLDGRPLRDVERLLQKGGPRFEFYMARLTEYSRFLDRFGLTHLLQDRERLTYGLTREVGGARVGVCGLNTAWNSGRSNRTTGGDKGRIWMAGSWQLAHLKPSLRSSDLRIALLHHPGNWLRAEEDPKFWRELRGDFDFILHGHEHSAWIESADDSALVISAGATFQQGELSFNLVQAAPSDKRATIWHLSWNEVGMCWVPHLMGRKTDEDGAWRGRWQGVAAGPSLALGTAEASATGYWKEILCAIEPLREALHVSTAYDFLYFSSALDELDDAANRFILWMERTWPELSATGRQEVLETALRLRDLPVSEEKTQRLTELALNKSSSNHNAHFFQIILLEFAERFTRPLGNVLLRLDEDAAASGARGEAASQDDFTNALGQLVSDSGVARFQGLLKLLRNHRGRLVRAIHSQENNSGALGEFSLEAVLDALWGSFDLVLTEERFTRKGATELVAALLEHEGHGSVKKMLSLLATLDSVIRGSDTVSAFQARLEKLEDQHELRQRDVKIGLRSLTLHSSQPELRRSAVTHLDDESAWRLLSLPQYPQASANEIAERILERKDELDRHRILFDLRYDDLMRLSTRRGEAETVEVQRFLLLIRPSQILERNPRYHRRFCQLLRSFVGAREGTLFLDPEILAMSRSLDSVTSEGQVVFGEAGSFADGRLLAELDELAIRKLLAQPIYFFTVISHPREAIWRKVLPHLGEPGVAIRCIENRGINPDLFSEILNTQQELFNNLRLQKSWALNPNAGRTLSNSKWILRKLSRRDLREVVYSRYASGDVKREAEKILGELSARRS